MFNFNKKNIMIKGLIIGFIGLLAVIIGNKTISIENPEKEKAIVKNVKDALDIVHFSPQKLNDDFSVRFFDEYLKNLDGAKRFFTQEDIKALEAYRFDLDDQILNYDLTFFNLSDKLMDNAFTKSRSFYAALLEKPFKFESNETLEMDPEKRSWAKDDDELKDLWRKIFKYEVLTRVHTDLENQKKSTKQDSINKTFSQLEKEARERVLKIYDDMFDRLKKVKREDRFEQYVNAFSNLYDPHTEYFSAKEKQDFDIQMQGKLEGIGARLQNDKEYTKIVEIIPGGPAWKHKELKANDLILRVAQEDSDQFVDLTGMRIDDVVTLIRGKKGTKVKLEIKKPDGITKIIQLTREEVIIDETKAKSVIVSEGNEEEIGFIRLPSFYSEFKADGNDCADDIKTEIEKLKAKNVKGIILDLRYNGGGSLPDVIKIAGYFIEKGPIVQVKQTNEKPYVHNDTDSDVLYNGPLVILVNEMSASASEIMAAAMQDYNRGIVLGSKATFGKGTVQRFFDLDNMMTFKSGSLKDLGNIKITTQKFYRINGGSTQLKGVESDIELPDNYMYMEVGEREFTNAMPWDRINPLTYKQDIWNISSKNDIINRSKARIKSDSIFVKVDENAKILKEYSDKTLVSLNLKKFSEDSKKRIELDEYFKKHLDREIASIKVKNLEVDLADIKMDSSRIARNDEWLKNIKKDFQLKEAIAVIKDLNELK